MPMLHRKVLLTTALIVAFLAGVAVYAKKKAATAPDDRQRALHAVDRLTFGPRPGDVEAVTAMGVDKWIDLQLHPDKIDDSAMQARLSGYRTLQMSAHEMVLAFPPNPVAKAVMEGKIADAERSVRARHLRGGHRSRGGEDSRRSSKLVRRIQQPRAMFSQPISPSASLRGARRTVSVDDLIALQPNERMQRILALPVAEQHDLLQGIPYPKRQALLAGLSPAAARNGHRAEPSRGGGDRASCNRRSCCAPSTAIANSKRCSPTSGSTTSTCSSSKGADRYLVTAYERDVIRPHVLGKFKDLLIATAQSPAMLFYLDNWQSEGPQLRCCAWAAACAADAPRPYWGSTADVPPPQHRSVQPERRRRNAAGSTKTTRAS